MVYYRTIAKKRIQVEKLDKFKKNAHLFGIERIEEMGMEDGYLVLKVYGHDDITIPLMKRNIIYLMRKVGYYDIEFIPENKK